MNRKEQIELLEYRILKLKNELPMLCDSDYYSQCYMIEQLEYELSKLLNIDGISIKKDTNKIEFLEFKTTKEKKEEVF